MNIPMTQRDIVAARALEGKVSLVTGSTSGIGLGIARALAAAGSAIVLNGFGKPEEIACTRSQLASQFGVTAEYSLADMSKAEAIEALDHPGVLRSTGCRGQQCRHPARRADPGIPRREMAGDPPLSSAFHTARYAL